MASAATAVVDVVGRRGAHSPRRTAFRFARRGAKMDAEKGFRGADPCEALDRVVCNGRGYPCDRLSACHSTHLRLLNIPLKPVFASVGVVVKEASSVESQLRLPLCPLWHPISAKSDERSSAQGNRAPTYVTRGLSVETARGVHVRCDSQCRSGMPSPPGGSARRPSSGCCKLPRSVRVSHRGGRRLEYAGPGCTEPLSGSSS